MQYKIRGLLSTCYHVLFDKYLFEPERAGSEAGGVAAEKSHDLFDTRSTEEIDKKNAEKARKTWLRRFLSAFNSIIKKSIEE